MLVRPVGQAKDQQSLLRIFALCAMAGGATTGLVVAIASGFVGVLPTGLRSVALVLVCLALLSIELAGATKALPQARRQIDDSVFFDDIRLGAAHFGFEYGTGCRTYVTAAAPYVMIATLVFMNPGLVIIVAAGAAFGFGRSLPLFQQATLPVAEWSAKMAAQGPVLTRGCTAAVVAIALRLVLS